MATAEVKVVESVENLDDVITLIEVAVTRSLEDRLKTLDAKMGTVLDFVAKVELLLEQAAPMLEQFAPMIEQLQDHPMLKMLLKG